MSALMGERARRHGHPAAEESVCFLRGKPPFVQRGSKSPVFREFDMRGVSSLLDLVNQQAQMRAVENLGEHYSLETSIGELALHHPVSCLPSKPINEARSEERRVGKECVSTCRSRWSPVH